MGEYGTLGYAYTLYPIIARNRWMSEGHPTGAIPYRRSYQMEGGVVDPDLNYEHKYSHYHSNQRGTCSSQADCPHGELCIDGTCAERCLNNNDCPLGSECKNGYCRVEFCKHDGDTSSGACNNQLHNRDEPNRALMLECDKHSDCPTNHCQTTAHGKFCGRPQNQDPIKMWRKYHAMYGMNRI